MNHNIYASILVMFLTIYAVRALPLTLIRKEIKNPFIRHDIPIYPVRNGKPDYWTGWLCGRRDPGLD